MDAANIKDVCRSCLKTYVYSTSIHEIYNNYFLPKIINDCTGLMVQESDGLPGNICYDCVQKFIDAFETRRQFIKSTNYLQEQLAESFIKFEIDNAEAEIFDNVLETITCLDDLMNENIEKLELGAEDEMKTKVIDSTKHGRKTAVKGPVPRKKKKLKECEEISEESDGPDVTVDDDDEEKEYPCSRCKKIFYNETSFKRHQPFHDSKKINCPLCNKQFTHKSNLKRHMRLHKDGTFPCDKCEKNFPSSNTLYEHMKIHRNKYEDAEEYVMKCEFCDEQTVSYSIFLQHMKTEHGVDKDKVKAFRCHICSCTFATKQGMFRHIDNIHENNRRNIRNRDRNFLCTECGSSFYTNFHLETHSRSHTGDRPFKCETCGKGFSQMSGLKMHKFTHTGERPYPCKICKKTFSQPGHVREHMMTHSDERPHVCGICNHSFRIKGNLTAHLMTHSGKKPHICGYCNKRFIQNTKLKLHIEKHHS